MKTVLVTGGAGYIGSHAVVELLDQGYHVMVIDSLENGFLDVIDSRCKFYQGNLQDLPFLEQIFQQNSIDCVMHFAAYIKIPESINNPNKYYSNNVYSTLCLLKIMQKYQVNKIIFSSTAAVYGEIQENRKVTEDFPTNPINPYGKSKLMAEEIIQDHAKVSPLCYAIFRYFNVAGAHEKYEIGQMDTESTALIPKLLQSYFHPEIPFSIFGTDYNTPDGTAIRDYIHVVDLVKAHIMAIPFLEKEQSGIFNLGSEKGYSVLFVFNTFLEIIQGKMAYQIQEKRAGDPSQVVASSQKASQLLGWKARYSLKEILESAFLWNQKNEKN